MSQRVSTTFSLADIVRDPAAAADDVGLQFQGREITYGQLGERSDRVAAALTGMGVRPGDRVAFLDRNTPEYFELLLGASKVGATTVAVNWRLTAPEQRFILDDAGAAVLVAGEALRDEAAALGDRPVIALGAEYEDWLAAVQPHDPGAGTDPDTVVLQLYTSGTTGTPKGAMITNRNLGAVLDGLAGPWHFDADSVSVVTMPTFHIGGAGYGLVGLNAGGRGLLFRDFDPAAVLDAFATEPVTNALLVPAMVGALCAAAGDRRIAGPEMRSVVYGAAPIDPTLLRRAIEAFGCPMIGSYGITETCGPVTQLDAADHDPEHRPELLSSVGRAFDWVRLDVVGFEDRRPVAAGTVGEVRIRGTSVMDGYWGRPEDTAAVIDADGWFATGDAGYLDAEGRLFLTDRVKDMIITGGENVYPVEVEHALAEHPAVADVAVFGIPHERWGETVMAVVVAEGDPPEAAELIAFARERIAAYKCPTAVEVVDEIPRNPSGKILKRELRAPFWARRDRSI